MRPTLTDTPVDIHHTFHVLRAFHHIIDHTSGKIHLLVGSRRQKVGTHEALHGSLNLPVEEPRQMARLALPHQHLHHLMPFTTQHLLQRNGLSEMATSFSLNNKEYFHKANERKVNLNKFLHHVHVADKIIDQKLQIFASFIRCLSIRTAKHFILEISKKSAAGSCLYCVFLSIQFHSRISFLVIVKMICFTVIFLTLQRWTDYVSVVCREGYIRMKKPPAFFSILL